MSAAPPSEALALRAGRWSFKIQLPTGYTLLKLQPNDQGQITLPFGTHVVTSSLAAEAQTVVIETADGLELYDTWTGVARPSVTAGVYRQGPRGIEVAVVFMKRWFGDIPSLQPLCDEEGFVVCAEPPGGLIDNIAGLDFLREVPPNAIVRRTALREIREEFGHLLRCQIRSLRVRRFPLATLGIAKASAFQAFVEVDPDVEPRDAHPEDAEQITGRRFLLLSEALHHCSKLVHRGVFWGRASTHTWALLSIDLEHRSRRRTRR